jgi:integrase
MTAMASWERRPGFVLLDDKGQPWERPRLTSTWNYERDTKPALAPISEAGLVLHGLRATACVRLLRAGANTRQISDMVGMSEQMVSRYTRHSDQKENATAAVLYLDRTRREPNENASGGSGGSSL